MKKQMFLSFVVVALCLSTEAHTKGEKKTIDVAVTSNGFEPNVLEVKPGTHVVLNVTRKVEKTCATDIQVPSKNIKVALKEMNKAYPVDLGHVEKGEIKFGCGMDMMLGGQILAK